MYLTVDVYASKRVRGKQLAVKLSATCVAGSDDGVDGRD